LSTRFVDYICFRGKHVGGEDVTSNYNALYLCAHRNMCTIIIIIFERGEPDEARDGMMRSEDDEEAAVTDSSWQRRRACTI